MLREDCAVAPGDLCAAQDGPQVLRVHDRVERDQERRVRVQKLLERPRAPRLQLGGDALVDARRHDVKAFWRNHLDS